MPSNGTNTYHSEFQGESLFGITSVIYLLFILFRKKSLKMPKWWPEAIDVSLWCLIVLSSVLYFCYFYTNWGFLYSPILFFVKREHNIYIWRTSQVNGDAPDTNTTVQIPGKIKQQNDRQTNISQRPTRDQEFLKDKHLMYY